MATNEQRKR